MSEDKKIVESKTVDSPWGKIKNCSSKPLRQPNTSLPELSITSSKTKEDASKLQNDKSENVQQINTININDGIINNSKLNVNAAEFIPCSKKNQFNEIQEVFEDKIDRIQCELRYMAVFPEKCKEASSVVGHILTSFLENENFMKSAINVILEESILEQNLHYSMARLCSNLYKTCGAPFLNLLIKSCEEEYTKLISNQIPNDPAYLKRICGFGVVLAELFLQIKVERKSVEVFGIELLDILPIILNYESEKSIKVVSQVLKFAGIKLEKINESSATKVDELFSRLQYISTYPDLDPNLGCSILKALELRANNWGRSNAEEPTTEAPSDNPEVSLNNFDEPVFFGPDGKVISEEETSFLHDNIPLSDDMDDYLCDEDAMDEEVMKDFEEFLKLSERKENLK